MKKLMMNSGLMFLFFLALQFSLKAQKSAADATSQRLTKLEQQVITLKKQNEAQQEQIDQLLGIVKEDDENNNKAYAPEDGDINNSSLEYPPMPVPEPRNSKTHPVKKIQQNYSNQAIEKEEENR